MEEGNRQYYAYPCFTNCEPVKWKQCEYLNDWDLMWSNSGIFTNSIASLPLKWNTFVSLYSSILKSHWSPQNRRIYLVSALDNVKFGESFDSYVGLRYVGIYTS